MKIVIFMEGTHRWTALTPRAWFASDTLPKTVQTVLSLAWHRKLCLLLRARSSCKNVYTRKCRAIYLGVVPVHLSPHWRLETQETQRNPRKDENDEQ